MKKILKKVLQNRLVAFGLILAVELVWLVIFVTRLASYSTVISVIFTVISLLAVLWIINRDDNPAYKVAWIILIMALPILGGLFYLAVGHKRPSRNMRRKMERERIRTEDELLQDPDVMEEIRALDRRIEGQVRYTSVTGGYPVYRGTSARYYQIGEELYRELLEELKKAEHSSWVKERCGEASGKSLSKRRRPDWTCVLCTTTWEASPCSRRTMTRSLRRRESNASPSTASFPSGPWS